MINQELLAYIRSAQSRGDALDKIKADLKLGGWNEDDLKEALNALNILPTVSNPESKPKADINTPAVLPNNAPSSSTIQVLTNKNNSNISFDGIKPVDRTISFQPLQPLTLSKPIEPFQSIPLSTSTVSLDGQMVSTMNSIPSNTPTSNSFTPSGFPQTNLNDGTIRPLSFTAPMSPRPKKSHRGLWLFIIIFLTLLILGGGSYAYLIKWGPFNQAPYNEKTLIPGMLLKASSIKTIKYSLALNIDIGPRDVDAKPFITDKDLGNIVPSLDEEDLLPSKFKFNTMVTAQTDLSVGELADWIFNLDSNIATEDFSGSLNIDILKKSEDFYFKINTFPNLFGVDIPFEKGQWFVFNINRLNAPFDSSDPKNTELQKDFELQKAELQDRIKEAEQFYKSLRTKLTESLKNTALIASQSNLFTFKSKPKEDIIDGKKYYKYELSINKENLPVFLEKVIIEAQKEFSNEIPTQDTAEIKDTLHSKEFQDFLDYYQNNSTLTLWVDSSGYPAILEQTYRLVPPDAAKNIRDKQINISFIWKFLNINEPVNIEAPQDPKDIAEYITASLEVARKKANNASIKATLSYFRAYGEIYYSDHNSYGTVSKGSCTTPKSIFTYPEIVSGLKQIQTYLDNEKISSPVACFSSPKGFAISAPIIDTENAHGYWCVDSTGVSKQISAPITSTICPSF